MRSRPAESAAPREPSAFAGARLEVVAGAGSGSAEDGPLPLRVATTMATWCASCRKEIPQLKRLRSEFGESVLGMYGVPIDAEDTQEGLKAWMAQHQPPYELLSGISNAERAAVKDTIMAELKQDAVPATILTGPDGRILATQWGPPVISRIRELLRSHEPAVSAARR